VVLNLALYTFYQKYTDSFEISKLKFASEENAIHGVCRVRILRNLSSEGSLGFLWLSVVTDYIDQAGTAGEKFIARIGSGNALW